MWCKMASQLTAEQQQMSSACVFFKLMLEYMAPLIPPQLSGVPWNLLTTGIIIITIIMLTFMPTVSFIAYMVYTTLLTLLVLKYKEAICYSDGTWKRRNHGT